MLVAAIVKTKSRFDEFHLPPHGARCERERMRLIGVRVIPCIDAISVRKLMNTACMFALQFVCVA